MNSDIEKKITAVVIIEVLGRPEKHLIDTLESIVKEIDSEDHIKVVNKKISTPKIINKDDGLFSAFVEVEVEVEELIMLAGLMFKYMPSHVEVVEPENFIVKNHELGDILTEITRRLHQYEEIVKVLQLQIQDAKNGVPQIQLKENIPQENNKNNKKPSKKESKKK